MEGPGHTVVELLAWARARLKDAGIEEFTLEGELIVQHVLDIDAARMFAGPEDRVPPGRIAEIQGVVQRRTKREPLAYITGTRGFYRREFTVTPDVLIPRQESELLVDLAVKWIAERPELSKPVRIADIGTGSGALAVTLAAERLDVTVDAVDLSPAAIQVARINAEAHGVADRIDFMAGDLGTPLEGRAYTLVLANLPYVQADSLAAAQPEVRHEPEVALLGGEDGLDVVRRFVPMLPRLMEPTGSLALFELDPMTAAGAVDLLESALPKARIGITEDLSGLERCVTAKLG